MNSAKLQIPLRGKRLRRVVTSIRTGRVSFYWRPTVAPRSLWLFGADKTPAFRCGWTNKSWEGDSSSACGFTLDGGGRERRNKWNELEHTLQVKTLGCDYCHYLCSVKTMRSHLSLLQYTQLQSYSWDDSCPSTRRRSHRGGTAEQAGCSKRKKIILKFIYGKLTGRENCGREHQG